MSVRYEACPVCQAPEGQPCVSVLRDTGYARPILRVHRGRVKVRE